MFYLLALTSMIGYGIQMAFLAHISRKVDALDISFYRNISFVITLLPLLFLASGEEILLVFEFWPELLVMGFTAVAALWGTFASFRFLPLGIADSFKKALTTISILFMGFIFLAESLSIGELILIFVVIGAIVLLGLQKNHMPHLDSRSLKGFFFILISSIPSAISVFMAGKLAREVNPFVAGYFWEVSIGIAALITILIRYLITGKKLHWLGYKKTGQIALAAWPTLLGTGGFTLAVTMGPIGIASSITVGSVAVSAMIAYFLHDEKLKKLQWLGMAVVMVAVIGLKFV